MHTNESLASLKRSQLIQLGINAGLKPSAAYSSKSTKIIEWLIANQEAAVAPVATIAHAPATVVDGPATITDPVQTVAVSEPVIDNVVAFASEATQTEIPAPPAPKAESHGLFKISRKVFQRQLAAVSKLPGGSHMPILHCVLIQFSNGRLAVEGTNLDVHVRTEAPAETAGTFSIAIPFTVLSKFVAKCTSDFLMAEVKGGSLFISDIENKTEMMGLPVNDWPPAPQNADVALMRLAGRELARVIGATIKSASTDESRYILNGVFMDTRSEPVMVSTDSRRLIRAAIELESNISPFEGIIPSFAAEVIRASIPHDASAVIGRTESMRGLSIRTESNGFSYIAACKLVDGRFPNYSQVIPDAPNYGAPFAINSAELLAALDRVLVVANSGENKTPGLVLNFEKDALSVSAVNASVGNGKETITVKGGDTPMKIGANGDYLREIIGSWSDERVTIRVKDGVSPILISADGKVAVVMPIRLP